MASPLEKARKDPKSMKGRILKSASKLYGKNGYQGTTTRMIAKEVGIDISTLYYHWGEKADLYEAVLTCMKEDLQDLLKSIERVIKGKSLKERLEVAINMCCDYYFSNPETTSLILLHYYGFSLELNEIDVKFDIADAIKNIAYSMGLVEDRDGVSVQAKAKVMAVVLSLFSFIGGEKHLREIIGAEKEEYREVVKDVLKFILIPAFVQNKDR